MSVRKVLNNFFKTLSSGGVNLLFENVSSSEDKPQRMTTEEFAYVAAVEAPYLNREPRELSIDDVQSIMTRANAATPGSWVSNDVYQGPGCHGPLICVRHGYVARLSHPKAMAGCNSLAPSEAEAVANGEFIAAARMDVPDLCYTLLKLMSEAE